MIHLDIKNMDASKTPAIALQVIEPTKAQPKASAAVSWDSCWEFVHVCVDDASRIAFSQIMPDEKSQSAVPFLKAACAYYATHLIS